MALSDVRERQRGPYCSIAYGAGGVAYLLWYLGWRRGDRTLLEDAQRWVGAMGRARGEDAYLAGLVPAADAEASVVNGRAGLHLIGALVAHALGDARRRRRHVDAYLEIGRRTDRPPELLHGDGGFLVGTLLLERHLGDPRLAPLADAIAARLLAAEWRRHGFAHGTTGMLHALVQWVAARGGVAPSRLRARLADVPRDLGGAPARFVPTWCNGAAGHVLLWAGAYRTLGDAIYLERAEECAGWMLAESATPGNLCCGHGGVAYALLALDRARPSRTLRDQALERTARGLAVLQSPWPNGLNFGYAGLACLAEDVLEETGGGFPLVEVG